MGPQKSLGNAALVGRFWPTGRLFDILASRKQQHFSRRPVAQTLQYCWQFTSILPHQSQHTTTNHSPNQTLWFTSPFRFGPGDQRLTRTRFWTSSPLFLDLTRSCRNGKNKPLKPLNIKRSSELTCHDLRLTPHRLELKKKVKADFDVTNLHSHVFILIQNQNLWNEVLSHSDMGVDTIKTIRTEFHNTSDKHNFTNSQQQLSPASDGAAEVWIPTCLSSHSQSLSLLSCSWLVDGSSSRSAAARETSQYCSATLSPIKLN